MRVDGRRCAPCWWSAVFPWGGETLVTMRVHGQRYDSSLIRTIFQMPSISTVFYTASRFRLAPKMKLQCRHGLIQPVLIPPTRASLMPISASSTNTALNPVPLVAACPRSCVFVRWHIVSPPCHRRTCVENRESSISVGGQRGLASTPSS